jgi:deoxyribonuclease V
VLVLAFPELEIVETRTLEAPLVFPYIPGLLSFREAPALIECFRALGRRPDLVLIDGQGIAHPRRLGLAAHVGLWLGIPTIGCAKKRLIGEHDEPGPERGRAAPLFDAGQRIGTVLRTRTRVKPLFISPGHLIDIPSATRLALACAPRFRLPEPTRLAHQCVTRLKRSL